MSLTLDDVLLSVAIGLVSSLALTGLWWLFVWMNNWYVVRHGGATLKFNFWQVFLPPLLVSCVLMIIHPFHL